MTVSKCKQRCELCYLIKISNLEENHRYEVDLQHDPVSMISQTSHISQLCG